MAVGKDSKNWREKRLEKRGSEEACSESIERRYSTRTEERVARVGNERDKRSKDSSRGDELGAPVLAVSA